MTALSGRDAKHWQEEDPGVLEHKPGRFTFCYTGCGAIVQCSTAKGPADDPHFRTQTGARVYWELRHGPEVERVPQDAVQVEIPKGAQ
jgi:hypothetical protein